MGVGTTHNAEWYLMGDPSALQRIDLITEEGARIAFDRTSSGASYMNGMFMHTATPTGFYGARLGWVGQSWALRFWDGSLAMFRSCDAPDNPCSVISARDAYGNIIRFNRDARGVLRSIQAGRQLLTFEYDDRNRIVRAAHGSHEATYSYDDRGRLQRSTLAGMTRSYRYGDRDEMVAIEEPTRTIEMTYDSNLRVSRQVVRRPGRAESVNSFEYTLYGDTVVETTVSRRNGSRTTYRWNRERRQDLEIHEGEGDSFVTVQFARPDGVFTQALTVSCTNRGLLVSETVEVVPGQESRVKAQVIDRICSE
jgi:YD repeat-containing protein